VERTLLTVAFGVDFAFDFDFDLCRTNQTVEPALSKQFQTDPLPAH
jgi:hypothetical protein